MASFVLLVLKYYILNSEVVGLGLVLFIVCLAFDLIYRSSSRLEIKQKQNF